MPSSPESMSFLIKFWNTKNWLFDALDPVDLVGEKYSYQIVELNNFLFYVEFYNLGVQFLITIKHVRKSDSVKGLLGCFTCGL